MQSRMQSWYLDTSVFSFIVLAPFLNWYICLIGKKVRKIIVHYLFSSILVRYQTQKYKSYDVTKQDLDASW